MTLSPEFPWLVAIGFGAQMIDGCIGMGYGIFSSTILSTFGIPPAVTSATVHAAEFVTAGVSSASHAWFRNIDRKIFLSLLIPGVIGGTLGAIVLAHVPVHIVRPFVWFYLLVTSLVVLTRVILNRPTLQLKPQGPGLGAIAGFLDAIGGGGWGTIVTSTMIARGVPPRYAIGTANAVVFFVALTISVSLWLQLKETRFDIVLALLIGGASAAPVAAYVTRHMPRRAATVAVGLILFLVGANGLFRTLT
jgi:uncharacterized membrane protein YfcA